MNYLLKMHRMNNIMHTKTLANYEEKIFSTASQQRILGQQSLNHNIKC